jgi:hypothetical protein
MNECNEEWNKHISRMMKDRIVQIIRDDSQIGGRSPRTHKD